MNRFMGMVPVSEIKIEKRYRVGDSQHKVTVQAGINGWTIIYADKSSSYKDTVDTAENNFSAALEKLKSEFSNVVECGVASEAGES